MGTCGADVEAGFTFAPELNQRSERLLEDSQQLPGDFFARQRFFHDLKLRRLRVLQAEVCLLVAKHLISISWKGLAAQLSSQLCAAAVVLRVSMHAAVLLQSSVSLEQVGLSRRPVLCSAHRKLLLWAGGCRLHIHTGDQGAVHCHPGRLRQICRPCRPDRS